MHVMQPTCAYRYCILSCIIDDKHDITVDNLGWLHRLHPRPLSRTPAAPTCTAIRNADSGSFAAQIPCNAWVCTMGA